MFMAEVPAPCDELNQLYPLPCLLTILLHLVSLFPNFANFYTPSVSM